MRFMMLLTLLQVIPKEKNVAFWLMVVVFIIIVLIVAKRYIKREPSSNNTSEDTFVAPRHSEENALADKPSNISVNKQVNKFQQLRDLKDLLDEGVLTQEEFDIEKTKILRTD